MPLIFPQIPAGDRKMRAIDNKWLLVRETIVLTALIENVICLLDPWFEKHGVKSYVTSGHRSSSDQLRIIKQASIARGIDKIRPEIVSAEVDGIVQYEGISVPAWAPAWNELLCDGFLVNPPFQTALLKAYFHPTLGKTIPKGQLINLSTHQRGLAFDVGGSGGVDKTIRDEVIVIQDAMQSKTIPQIKSIVPETVNNCVHVTCQEV